MADSETIQRKEFQEIGHCGGQIIIRVKTDENGCRSIQFAIQHSSITPAAWFGIYALPQGFPVAIMNIGGISTSTNNPMRAGYYPIFIASDNHGMFGHQCPNCNGYWRSGPPAAQWRMTCPYCGIHTDNHGFLTAGQRKYIHDFCEQITQAIQSEHDGEYIINMDEVADAAGKDLEKPKFYYAEESQQNKYNCAACNETNDILGRYGYCSNCGTHNGVFELEKDINDIRYKIKEGHSYEACVRNAVSAFDSYVRQIAKQLATRVPLTAERRKEWLKKKFHNLKPCSEDFNTIFDIKVFKQFKKDDIDFAILMFHRRHVYEHNGGEVDEKYIRDSGDTSVRPKQIIRESSETSLRIADLVIKMSKNIHNDFHDIFPIEEKSLLNQQ